MHQGRNFSLIYYLNKQRYNTFAPQSPQFQGGGMVTNQKAASSTLEYVYHSGYLNALCPTLKHCGSLQNVTNDGFIYFSTNICAFCHTESPSNATSLQSSYQVQGKVIFPQPSSEGTGNLGSLPILSHPAHVSLLWKDKSYRGHLEFQRKKKSHTSHFKKLQVLTQ